VPGEYSITDWDGLRLAWQPELDGGGRLMRHHFNPVVEHLFGHVGRAFEFCAGPGFIGFSLLWKGLCDHLVLADVNPRAVAAINETIRLNDLHDKVTVYLSDGLEDIPDHERWDLVVSNPPHFPEQVRGQPSLILDDPGWRLHRHFYERVGAFLAPGGSVLMEENSEGSTPDEFLPMIAAGGLAHVRTIWHTAERSEPHFYFIWVQKGLPGMTFEDRPQAVTLVLGDGADARVPAARPCAIRLVNETARPVEPFLVDGSGRTLLSIPLGTIAAGGDLELPQLALKPGTYEVRDRDGEGTIVRFTAG
jgi:hypothetical protein